MFVWMVARIARIAAFRAERRSLGPLLVQDDRALRDIGLTRADLEAGLARPRCLGLWHAAWRGAIVAPADGGC